MAQNNYDKTRRILYSVPTENFWEQTLTSFKRFDPPTENTPDNFVGGIQSSNRTEEQTDGIGNRQAIQLVDESLRLGKHPHPLTPPADTIIGAPQQGTLKRKQKITHYPTKRFHVLKDALS